MTYEIINEECLHAMSHMDSCSVDAVVTDPPYGLAFMGAQWDSFNGVSGKQTTVERQEEGRRYADENKGAPRYANSHGKRVTRREMIAFQERMTPIFEESLRVAKPGAHMLCFGGTRTFHRLTCAIEDAGWEIRDTIMWVYGSGFPKSMDVGKAIDKALGAERKVIGEHPNPAGNKAGGNSLNMSVVGMPEKAYITEPATDQAREWDGWGTCLKPAWEPIIVARKPLDGTVAHNVMEYGTGAINIDGCRVGTDGGTRAVNFHGETGNVYGNGSHPKNDIQSTGKGRFPANLVHDGSQEVLELFPEVARSTKCRQARSPRKTDVYGLYSMEKKDSPMVGYEDGGTAARFFYCAKASKKDRGEGNDHPTVKPNALMRWLVRLVCPQGGTVLDPFMGSGSTGVACIQEGMRFVGIEMDEHYCEIANARCRKEQQ